VVVVMVTPVPPAGLLLRPSPRPDSERSSPGDQRRRSEMRSDDEIREGDQMTRRSEMMKSKKEIKGDQR